MLQSYLLPFIILCCLNFVSCQWKSYDLKDENNKIFYINKTTLQEYRDTSF